MTASNSFLLPSALQTCLQEIIDTANMSQAGIRAILLCTTEGVPLGRVLSEQTMHPDMLQMIESAFAPSSKQFPVLELEKLKQVTAFYDHGIVVHQYHGPVVRATCRPMTVDALSLQSFPLFVHCHSLMS
jgi:hypothetical protein